MKTIAIMQPTYLPWIGYFAMIDRVDEFIFLDDVQFAHRSWQQRNQIKTANGPQWLSVPVQIKGEREQTIAQVKLAERDKALAKHLAAIDHNYAKAPFYKQYAVPVRDLLSLPVETIGALNIGIIEGLCGILGIKTPLLRSSSFPAQGMKADRLASLCVLREAKHYLSAPGSKDYIEESDAFDKAGITLVYHDYNHPVYPQLHGEFVPYMSIIDLLFNAGPESLAIIKKGCAQ